MSDPAGPPSWLLTLGASVLTFLGGGVGVEVVRRWRSKPDLREANARADKAEAEGGATALSATAAAFGELAKYMQHELGDLRERCARLEEQLQAGQAMVSKLELENIHLQTDNERLTARNEQLAGENRQLKQVMESAKRTGAA